MKLSAILLASVQGEGKAFIDKNEASEFLLRDTRANTGLLTEEFRTGNLERECSEEVCDWDEAMEIFEDADQTDMFMNKMTHMCENTKPCFVDGSTGRCENKWGNYWCECKVDWYGKDCDFIDVGGSYTCQNPDGCDHPISPPKKEEPEKEELVADEQETVTEEFTTVSIGDDVNPVLEAFVADVQCDAVDDKFVIHLPAWDAGYLMMGLDQATATCGPTETSSRGSTYIYSFNDCGTRLTMLDDRMIYENHIGRGPLITRGVIRDLGITYNVRCVIDRLGHVDNYDKLPEYGPNGELINGTGTILPIYALSDPLLKEFEVENDSKFIFRLNVYHDSTFQEKFMPPQFPLMRHFKQRIYLGVEVLTQMDFQYIFTQGCWATPNADPNSRSAVYYPIMADGCPTDQYTGLNSRLDLEDRFNTQTFKFQDSDFVYIQCDVIVCDLRIPNDPECQSTCRADKNRQTRQTVERSRRSVSDKVREIVTVGPLEVRKINIEPKSSSSSPGWLTAGFVCSAFMGYIGFTNRARLGFPKNQVNADVL